MQQYENDDARRGECVDVDEEEKWDGGDKVLGKKHDNASIQVTRLEEGNRGTL